MVLKEVFFFFGLVFVVQAGSNPVKLIKKFKTKNFPLLAANRMNGREPREADEVAEFLPLDILNMVGGLKGVRERRSIAQTDITRLVSKEDIDEFVQNAEEKAALIIQDLKVKLADPETRQLIQKWLQEMLSVSVK